MACCVPACRECAVAFQRSPVAVASCELCFPELQGHWGRVCWTAPTLCFFSSVGSQILP